MSCDVCDDLEWLLDTGETNREAVCNRLGRTPVALEKHLWRCGRHDLRRRIPALITYKPPTPREEETA